MRNLKLKYLATYDTEIADPKILVLDPNTANRNTVYICTDDQLYSFNVETAETTLLYEVSGIVACEFLSLENQVCIATENGEVLLINPDTLVTNEVTFCGDGIEQMVWSPDQEVIVFITKIRNLVLMNCSFEATAEADLNEEMFGENVFINVGWGKKETQFHGSEGKRAAKQTLTFSIPDNVAELPQKIEISWRADGGYFAVSFVGPQGRMFKVFDKEGTLQYTSEKMNDLLPEIAWRPTGTWVAMPHKLPNKSTIALFEKNGLRHREIVLPFKFEDEEVVSLKWSADSDILSVETRLNDKSNLYLYTMKNYHWYLKQTLSFNGILSSYVWSNRIGEEKSMYIILPDGTLGYYTWTYTINQYQVTDHRYHCQFPTDYRFNSALIGVIDGKQLLVTNFRKGIVPPPMSSWQIECDSFINSCAFLTTPSLGEKFVSVFLYTNNNELLLYSLRGDNDVKLQRQITLPDCQVPLAHHHFVASSEMSAHWIQSVNRTSILWSIRSKDSNPTSMNVDEIICSLEGMSGGYILMYTIDGRLFVIFSDSTSRIERNKFDLVPGCEIIQQFAHNCQTGYVSLDNRLNLRLNTKVVATDVTSFHITRNYIVATTLGTMKFLRLDDGQVINERKIERGAKIIMILAHGSTTILQLPRGNLEVLHPRVLCLELVGELLDKKHYFLAMDLARKQRINLNILCDHNIGQFLQHMRQFITTVSPQWLNLFLTDLQNEDFTMTMYSSNYLATERVYPDGFEITNKVSHICAKLCKEMETVDFQKYILPIITTQVKVGNLTRALQIIWEEKQKEGASGDERTKADEALKYLLYLVDINQLYDEALGMYDFGLVLMVAKKSQKDPREFLQFLNELKVLEENYMKYKIDLHLKRYSKALVNISDCGEDRFSEALDLVKTHNLYKEALEAYQKNKVCLQKIAQAYGDYLRENGKLENASIMYERAGDTQQAVACARHVLDWQRCLSLTKKDGVYPQNVAISLVPSLMEHGQYDGAFEILRRYADNFTDGISCLLKGNSHLRAIFEVKMENPKLLDSLILPHLLAYKKSIESNLIADRELFLKHKNRLLTIREKKVKDANMDEIDDIGQIDESDLISDTTSMHSSRYSSSSRSTGKTFRSSKNRRKHERKILSLKEGNPFEDIALIDALHNHIVKVYALQQHIHDTCKALVEAAEDTHARHIQHQYKDLLHLIRDSLDEIWTPEIMTTAQYITGPNVDYAALQNEQRYAMINPLKRFKPQLNLLDWEHEILR